MTSRNVKFSPSGANFAESAQSGRRVGANVQPSRRRSRRQYAMTGVVGRRRSPARVPNPARSRSSASWLHRRRDSCGPARRSDRPRFAIEPARSARHRAPDLRPRCASDDPCTPRRTSGPRARGRLETSPRRHPRRDLRRRPGQVRARAIDDASRTRRTTRTRHPRSAPTHAVVRRRVALEGRQAREQLADVEPTEPRHRIHTGKSRVRPLEAAEIERRAQAGGRENAVDLGQVVFSNAAHRSGTGRCAAVPRRWAGRR